MDNGLDAVVPSKPTDARHWARILARYREPSHARSIVEIAITLGPLVALWGLSWTAYYFGYWWLSLLIAVPAAGFLVRLFMIQHDCGHGAFFRHRMAHDWVGRVIGVLTLTPYGKATTVMPLVSPHSKSTRAAAAVLSWTISTNGNGALTHAWPN